MDNQPNFTLSNHDQPRAATKHARGNTSIMKLLAAMVLTLKGTPTLYYGEEIGMENVFVTKKLR